MTDLSPLWAVRKKPQLDDEFIPYPEKTGDYHYSYKPHQPSKDNPIVRPPQHSFTQPTPRSTRAVNFSFKEKGKKKSGFDTKTPLSYSLPLGSDIPYKKYEYKSYDKPFQEFKYKPYEPKEYVKPTYREYEYKEYGADDRNAPRRRVVRRKAKIAPEKVNKAAPKKVTISNEPDVMKSNTTMAENNGSWKRPYENNPYGAIESIRRTRGWSTLDF